MSPDAVVQAWPQFLEIAERTRGNIFFGVCPRPRQWTDQAHHIRTVRVLWADLDGVTVAEALNRIDKAGLPKPSIIINSGHGIHLYWILVEAFIIDDAGEPVITKDKKKIPLSPKAEKIQSIMRGMYAVIGGDHTQDVSRILRMPDSMNRKNERNGQKPLPCTLVECHPDRRYPLSLSLNHSRFLKKRNLTMPTK